jgi:general secretion pathway protein C
MRAASIHPVGTARAALWSLPALAAAALLAWVLAYWTWAVVAPAAEPRTRTQAPAGARVESAYGLFGSASSAPAVAPAGSTVKLLGVIAATGTRPAYAVLQLDGRQSLAVRGGEEVAPGIRLIEVHADGVVLQRGGAREALAFALRDAPANPAFAGNK